MEVPLTPFRPELSKAVSFLKNHHRNASPETPDELFLATGKEEDNCRFASIVDSTGYALGGAVLYEKCRWYGAVISYEMFAIVSGHEMRFIPRATGENIVDIQIDDETTALEGWSRKWYEPLTLSLTTPDRKTHLSIFNNTFAVSDANVRLIENGGPIHCVLLNESRIFPPTYRWNGDLFVLASLLFLKMQMKSFLWGSFS